MSMQVKHKKTISFLQLTLDCFSFLYPDGEPNKLVFLLLEFFWAVGILLVYSNCFDGSRAGWRSVWTSVHVRRERIILLNPKETTKKTSWGKWGAVSRDAPTPPLISDPRSEHSTFSPLLLFLPAFKFHVKKYFDCLSLPSLSAGNFVHVWREKTSGSVQQQHQHSASCQLTESLAMWRVNNEKKGEERRGGGEGG